jgi:hypothetical protein
MIVLLLGGKCDGQRVEISDNLSYVKLATYGESVFEIYKIHKFPDNGGSLILGIHNSVECPLRHLANGYKV